VAAQRRASPALTSSPARDNPPTLLHNLIARRRLAEFYTTPPYRLWTRRIGVFAFAPFFGMISRMRDMPRYWA
jgi:hypothetical protein